MSDALIDLIRPQRLTTVVDIGANPIDAEPPYRKLLDARLCRVIGFEPQPAALAALDARKSDLETYLPHVVGDGSAGTLKVCRASGMTSLFTPDSHALRHFPRFAEWGQVVEEIPVQTHRLDDIRELGAFDFLKMDVQGSELAVLHGGSERLKTVVAIQAEVSFIPLYRGQPIFGEIDLALRSLGFVPHSFAAINRRLIEPFYDDDPYKALNQLLEADVVYVRDFMQPSRMSAEQLKHLAVTAHHCCGSFDLAANCLYHLAKTGAAPPDAVERYVESLRAGASA
jgi:FkbM family methyltransferase